jgi:hypothetical protein
LPIGAGSLSAKELAARGAEAAGIELIDAGAPARGFESRQAENPGNENYAAQAISKTQRRIAWPKSSQSERENPLKFRRGVIFPLPF